MTRRQLIQAAGSLPAWRAVEATAASTDKQLRNLGGAPAGFPVRSRMARDSHKSFDFVEYCHNLGLGVVEWRLDYSDPDAPGKFRKEVEAYHMRSIVEARLPRQEGDVEAFEASVKSAKAAGVMALHTAMTPRRYEQYATFDAFKQSFEQNQKTIALAEPVLRKHQVRLAIENHKGWRALEQAAWLKRLGSEWVGVHFDFGNNLSLCEDPADTLRILQPYVVSCHIKDMAVEPYEDGFLLSEVPLGEGLLDLKGMVQSLQAKDPNIPFDLEMITRDPLKIPVFTEKYWVTFDDSFSPLPGRDLARVLEIVHKNRPKTPLPRVAGLSSEAQLKLEDDNISKSIQWARQNLNVS
jgi:3-oxoisoapionate decarboxylase